MKILKLIITAASTLTVGAFIYEYVKGYQQKKLYAENRRIMAENRRNY